MKRINQKWLSWLLVLCIAMLPILAAVPASATTVSKSNMIITDYSVKPLSNTGTLPTIKSGDKVNLVFSMKNTGLKSEEVTNAQNEIEITKTVDSFRYSGTPIVQKTSVDGQSFACTITFEGVTYTGTGNSFQFLVSYPKLNWEGDSASVSVSECVEGSTDNNPSGNDEAPVIMITKSELAHPLEADETVSLNIYLSNLSKTSEIRNMVMNIETSEGISLVDNNSTMYLKTIPAQGGVNLILSIKGASVIESTNQWISFSMKYDYYGKSGIRQSDTTTDRVNITSKLSDKDISNSGAPVIKIERNDMSPVKADTSFPLTLSIQNLSKTTAIQDMKISLETSEALVLNDNASAHVIKTINAGKKETLKLSLKSDKAMTSASQYILVNIKYTYKTGNTTQTENSSERIMIPVKLSGAGGSGEAPLIQIKRKAIPSPIKEKENFNLNLQIFNKSEDSHAENLKISFETSEGFILKDAASARIINELKKDSSYDLRLELKGAESIPSAAQYVSVIIRYDYMNNGTRVSETTTERIMVPVQVSEGQSGEGGKESVYTPNLIVNKYSYGEMIEAGQEFELDLSFKNTSTSVAVRNIVMTLETGEGLSIASTSNTFFFDRMDPQGIIDQKLPIRASAEAKPENSYVNISFKYEYENNKTKEQASTSEKIAIPLYQPDRFKVSEPIIPDYVTQGEETSLSFPVVNEGKNVVSNIRATLEGADIDILESSMYVGNYESGSSGTIDFIFTPLIAGELKVIVTITYEDASLEEKSIQYPITLNAGEAYNDDYFEEQFPEEIETTKKLPWWSYIIMGIVGLLLIVIVIRFIKKKKKKKQAVADNEFLWEDDQPKGEDADEKL